MKKRLITIVVAGLALAACGDTDGEFDDATVGVIDDVPQFVMTNLDEYPNLAVRCFGPHLIITTTRDYGDAVNINWNDPMCEDGDVLEWLAATFPETYSTGED